MDKIRVTIFGGGVTGLSAAHELIERGFDVTVVEQREDPFRPGSPQVGGMARTQWARFPGQEPGSGTAPWTMVRARRPASLASALRDETLWYSNVGNGGSLVEERAELRFAEGSVALDDRATRRLEAMVDGLVGYLEREVAVDDSAPENPSEPFPEHLVEYLYVDGYRDGTENQDLGLARAREVAATIGRLLAGTERRPNGRSCAELVRIRIHDLGAALEDDPRLEPREKRLVRLRLREVLLPGEHGYRFFPAFYKHVFDVMRRTPLLEERPLTLEELARRAAQEDRVAHARDDGDAPGRFSTAAARKLPRTKLVETGLTAFDNLESVTYHSIAQRGNEEPPSILPRIRPTSLKEALAALRAVQEEFGFQALDLARYQLCVLQYLTSCAQRREKYEELSWADFARMDTYSAQFQKVMDVWPQALIGMRSYSADARTAGNMSTQMMLDQIRAGGFRDGTLNGPTSVAWLDPWRRYLADQGVRFVHGKLDSISLPEDGSAPSFHATPALPSASLEGYVILALPAEETSDVLRGLGPRLQASAPDGDLAKAVAFMADWDDRKRTQAEPEGALQHFSGIQYYLEQDHSLVRGHTYFANSTWGLTSISQAQFRQDRLDWRDQYRGILSVDIGSCYAPGSGGSPAVWESTPSQVAREIWKQMNEGIETRQDRLPDPLWYHIDDDLVFKADAPGIERNDTPYMLSLRGEFAKRPGRECEKHGFLYDVALKQAGGTFRGIVLAGVFMKTYTRLATMEAANESARHAVNAILRDIDHPAGRAGYFCTTWNLEADEVPDFDWLKELDRKLCERGLPHLVEILELDPLLRAQAAGGGVGDPLATVQRLVDAFSDPGAWPWNLRSFAVPGDVIRALIEAVSGAGRRSA